MLRMRNSQGDDGMFRWIKTEMKKELVMSQSSYAKIAGLQSEVGRVVITRVAGSELEYKRTLNMYRKDAACTVNNIRREQIKMRMKLARYVRKIKQTRLDHARMIKEQQRHDRERELLEELHLRLKFEAAAKTPEPRDDVEITVNNVIEPDPSEDDPESDNDDSHLEFKGGPVFLQTGIDREQVEEIWHSKEKQEEATQRDSRLQQNSKSRKQSIAFAPMLPMIDEVEKEADETCEESEKQTITEVPDRFDLRVWDDTMSVSSYGGRIKRKNDVSFSDIIKLKYSGTKNLFDLVHKLAKKHGIPDVDDKVPDPRDNVVHRGSTNDSLRLQAAVLYPMKYGYNPTSDTEVVDRRLSVSKSPAMASVNEIDKASENSIDNVDSHQRAERLRRVSLDSKRSMFLSGKHSLSVEQEHSESLSQSESSRSGSPRKLRSRDMSMPELVDRVSRIKVEQADRLSGSQRIENELISSYNFLTPSYKPSSSRSSRSLPVVSRETERNGDRNVTWTQALGLLRGVHSLDDTG